MKNFKEQFSQLKQIRLEAEKKSEIKSALFSYMRLNPVAIPARAFFPQRYLAPFAFAGLILILGGSTTMAAEKALPGDPLYAVKINFNEPLIGALNISGVAKASWQAQLAERRLEEADQLAMQGKLSYEKQNEISSTFEEATNKAEKEIASLTAKGRSEDAENISNNLESSLKAHDKILADLEPKKEESPAVMGIMAARSAIASDIGPHDKMRSKIQEVLNELSKTRGETEIKVASEEDNSKNIEAAQGKIGAAENVLASVNSFLEKNASKMSQESLKDANARLAVAETFLASAKSKLEENAYSDASILANRALRKAQETRVLASAQIHVESDEASSGTPVRAAVNFLKSTGEDDETGVSAIMSTGVSESSSSEPEGSSTQIQLNVNGELHAE